MEPRTIVRISTDPMSLEGVCAVADGAGVELASAARERMRESRRMLDDAIGRGEAIYGVTTGVGHARNERLPIDALRSLQPMLVEMHVGALGEILPTARVRAALAAHLNGLTRGGAGGSVAVAEGLAALLNHGIHPLIPAEGSVGTGDLGQLALAGRTLLGRGEVEMAGRRMDASQALASAGLGPLTLEPKDALAVISSNAVSIGHAALLVRRCRRLMMLADLVASVSMEATGADPSPIDPAVASVRGSDGQALTSQVMRRALSASSRIEDPAGQSVQDPLSFRVVPQVHGACRDVLGSVAEAVASELNAASDNPMIDLSSGRVISNGNFQAMNLALSVESWRLALAHVGLLSERRMGHLWDTAVTSLGAPGPLEAEPSPANGQHPSFAGLALRYPAAARVARLRHLAQPVTLDVPPLDLAVEDHATNLAEALSMTEAAMAVLEDIMVVELLIAWLILETRPESDAPGRGTRPLRALIAEELASIPAGSHPDEVHGRIRQSVWRELETLLQRGGLSDLHSR